MTLTETTERPGRVDVAAVRAIQQDGYAVLPEAYEPERLAAIEAAVAPAVEKSAHRRTDTYAARNVLPAAPELADLWRTPLLEDAVQRVLGAEAGLVGAAYLNKPPGDSWAVPFHKDLTIAVRPGRADSSLYSLPRIRDGVPHVEAPLSVLRAMLTLRIHLDDVTEANGPLRVAVGSHVTGKQLRVDGFDVAPIYAAAGDVLALRPLLAHASGHTRPGTMEHRRVLQLSFAGNPTLPDGFRWADFVPV